MKRITFQLWAKDFLFGLADHTSVKCIEEDPDPDLLYKFTCWGGDASIPPNARLMDESSGLIDVVSLYRYTIDLPNHHYPDTAGIGIYGINGVCHQSANCFLYSTEPRIGCTNKIHGYWLSSWLYGTFGTDFKDWKNKVYKKYFDIVAGTRSVVNDVRKIYKSLNEVDINELIVQDVKFSTDQFLSLWSIKKRFDYSPLEKLHREFLSEKNKIVSSLDIDKEIKVTLRNSMIPGSDVQSEWIDIGEKINNKCKELQEEIRKIIADDDTYRYLNGFEKDEDISYFNIIDLELIK